MLLRLDVLPLLTHRAWRISQPCRSASRVGSRDGNANRKRIKALRLELQKKGWKSVGY